MKKYVMGVLFSEIVGMAHGYVECDDKTKCEEICDALGVTQYLGSTKYSCEKPLASSVTVTVCMAHKTSGGAISHVCGGEAYNLTSCVKK